MTTGLALVNCPLTEKHNCLTVLMWRRLVKADSPFGDYRDWLDAREVPYVMWSSAVSRCHFECRVGRTTTCIWCCLYTSCISDVGYHNFITVVHSRRVGENKCLGLEDVRPEILDLRSLACLWKCVRVCVRFSAFRLATKPRLVVVLTDVRVTIPDSHVSIVESHHILWLTVVCRSPSLSSCIRSVDRSPSRADSQCPGNEAARGWNSPSCSVQACVVAHCCCKYFPRMSSWHPSNRSWDKGANGYNQRNMQGDSGNWRGGNWAYGAFYREKEARAAAEQKLKEREDELAKKEAVENEVKQKNYISDMVSDKFQEMVSAASSAASTARDKVGSSSKLNPFTTGKLLRTLKKQDSAASNASLTSNDGDSRDPESRFTSLMRKARQCLKVEKKKPEKSNRSSRGRRSSRTDSRSASRRRSRSRSRNRKRSRTRSMSRRGSKGSKDKRSRSRRGRDKKKKSPRPQSRTAEEDRGSDQDEEEDDDEDVEAAASSSAKLPVKQPRAKRAKAKAKNKPDLTKVKELWTKNDAHMKSEFKWFSELTPVDGKVLKKLTKELGTKLTSVKIKDSNKVIDVRRWAGYISDNVSTRTNNAALKKYNVTPGKLTLVDKLEKLIVAETQ
eukprot:TRINITY_DN34802_c0_g2_i1.p1 TRINITY_DN34802_c0_g2~~TRINITY_DN34802_c0_g2_i1.p1  ORF type:complete len:634 (-),score=96.84 TRINITY_DN34802_c0_g2_i1:186-2033(-)